MLSRVGTLREALKKDKLDRMVDRVKPWFMVHSSGFYLWFHLWFCSWFSAWFGAWCMDLADTQEYLELQPEPCTSVNSTQAH